MSDQRNDNPNRPDGAHEPSMAELLRRAADDELTRPQRARLDEHLEAHPEDKARLDFERDLRKHVASAMTGARAPDAVRDAALAALRDGADEATDDAPAPIVRRERSFWSRMAGAPLAIAAVVLLALTVGIVLQRTGNQANIWLDDAQQATVVSFIGNEHNRCASIECSKNPKWTANDVQGATVAVSEYLGVELDRLDLADSGFALTGAGPCHVPGDGKSMHLLYRTGQTLDAPSMSLFIQLSDEAVEPDIACLCDQTDSGEILIWRRDGLIYYLLCPDETIANQALASLGAPTRRVPI